MVINRAHQFFGGGAGWHVHVHVVQLPHPSRKKNPTGKTMLYKKVGAKLLLLSLWHIFFFIIWLY